MAGQENDTDTLEEAAVWAVDAFDQANTNNAIVYLGRRGEILHDAIRDLRAALLRQGIKTSITQEQADSH